MNALHEPLFCAETPPPSFSLEAICRPVVVVMEMLSC
jgi:hypothetical protein